MSVAACHLMNSFSMFGDIPTLWLPPLQHWNQNANFWPPLQMECGHMTLVPSTRCTRGQNSSLKGVKCANSPNAKLSIFIEWMMSWALSFLGYRGAGLWRQHNSFLIIQFCSVVLRIVSGSWALCWVPSPSNHFWGTNRFLKYCPLFLSISYSTVLTLVFNYCSFSVFLQIFIQQKIINYLLFAV